MKKWLGPMNGGDGETQQLILLNPFANTLNICWSPVAAPACVSAAPCRQPGAPWGWWAPADGAGWMQPRHQSYPLVSNAPTVRPCGAPEDMHFLSLDRVSLSPPKAPACEPGTWLKWPLAPQLCLSVGRIQKTVPTPAVHSLCSSAVSPGGRAGQQEPSPAFW